MQPQGVSTVHMCTPTHPMLALTLAAVLQGGTDMPILWGTIVKHREGEGIVHLALYLAENRINV